MEGQLPEKRGQSPCPWMPLPRHTPRTENAKGSTTCTPWSGGGCEGSPQGDGPRTFSSLLMELWRATLSIRPT